jgi:radical SAM superfamily enzyme YgiQ (UPF0313 family)
MTGLFLNLPYIKKVARKYNCSYNTPTFLIPPLELLSLAGVFRAWHNGTPYLIDAIASSMNLEDVCRHIETMKPDIIVTIAGFEFLDHDIDSLNVIKTRFPDIPVVLFGHYAGIFHREIFNKSRIDYIIHGEPELIFHELLLAIQNRKNIAEINGISYRNAHADIHRPGGSRIPNPNELPMPAYDLLQIDHYSEPFFPKPYVTIQSARGCPYTCNYCVKTYGTKLTALTPENMLHYIQKLVELHRIRSFRFIDDTFTAVPSRVTAFCRLLIDHNLHYLKWSCFSRPDTLNREMLEYMKKAGCSRIYFGIESGSQKMLDFYNKGLQIAEVKDNLLYCRSLGIETVGFFMVGAPDETPDDLQQSIDFAISSKLDFITIFQFVAYPGTPIFRKMEQLLDFSVLPYQNRFKDEKLTLKAMRYQKHFFRKFYLRPSFVKSLSRLIMHNHLKEVMRTSASFISYLLLGHNDLKRKDYI